MDAAPAPGPAPQPQRRWQAACPNCGATVEFASAASASAVCSYCRSTLLREGEALRKIGQSAALIEDYSPLQLGACGHFSGEPFTVVGRLQIAYADGQWNEWHLLFNNEGQRSAWLSEDNGSFVLSFDIALPSAAPQAHELVVGTQQIMAGQPWQVAALTRCSIQAAQGELPQPPVLQIEHLRAELRNSRDEVGSLDYTRPAAPVWSVGRAVRLAELSLSGLRDDSIKPLEGRAFHCPSCGASLNAQLGSSLSLVCAQCQAVIDIRDTAAAELPHYLQATGREPDIPLGQTGRLAFGKGLAVPWQVVGYQERCEVPDERPTRFAHDSDDSGSGDDSEQTFWREYLLFNRQEGFVFLVDTETGWSLVRPLTGAPTRSLSLNASIEWQGQTYRRTSPSYTAKTTHVLGEFYWRVEREATVLISDYACHDGAQRRLLSREQSGDEITWSAGQTLDASSVARAFNRPLHGDGRALGMGASPAYTGSIPRKVVIALFVLFVVFLMVKALTEDDCADVRATYGDSSAEYAQCRRAGGPRVSPGAYGGGAGGGSYGGFGSGGGGHK